MSEVCLVVDFGSQFTQLISRKLRELKVKSEVIAPLASQEAFEARLRELNPKAIILSGGPASVYDKNAPQLGFDIKKTHIPVLGICYGMQWMVHEWGGKVAAGHSREYGVEKVSVERGPLFAGVDSFRALMSHGDHAETLPNELRVCAHSSNGMIAAIEHIEKKCFGLQFHPEVHHTENGLKLLENFLKISRFSFDWDAGHVFEHIEKRLREQVRGGHILCALSGGVDSAVVAVLLHKIFPNQVTCLSVDTGLLRKNEMRDLKRLFEEKFHFEVKIVDAESEFLSALNGVEDPEIKRKKIGHLFIDIFERESKKLPDIRYLAQGTLYPDVIESQSFHGGPSAKIKTHHNVGGLPEKLPFELVEPLRDLFKDEARRLGEYLGMPHDFVWRHPFPGPALAVRILGEVTKEKCDVLREADARLQEVLKETGWYEKLWQSFCVFLPVRSVGVMGDHRTYENVVAVRCVQSEDGMTAHIAPLETAVLEKISSRIINEVRGINRVVYDISSKPPATIEWE